MSSDSATSAPATTFSDPAREDEYRTNGYVVMPVLAPADVAQLLDFYWTEVHQSGDHGLTVDHMRDDRSVMERISEHTAPLWERVVPPLFADHRAVFTTFVVKHPGPESQMRLHDDLSWVREPAVRSGTLWMPLVDVGPDHDNGALGVVPRSHELGIELGGNGTPDLIRPYEHRLLEGLVEPSVPAGSAVYYDSRTLHASRPNLSDAPRVAIACGIVPTNADLLYVVATGRRHRVVFGIPREFYLQHSPRQVAQQMPDGYEMIDEFDEDTELPPTLVEDILGGSGAAHGDPVVPWEIRPVAEPALLLAPTRRFSGGRSTDLHPTLTPVQGTATAAGWTLTADAGDVGTFDPSAADVGELPDTSAWSLRPWSRATLSAPDDASAVRLLVLDGPRVSSGLCDGDAVANPDPGDEFELLPGRTYRLWNDGPGEFSVALRPAPESATPPPRLLARLRDRFR